MLKLMKSGYNLKPYLIFATILAVLMLITAFAGTFIPTTYSDLTRPQRVAESQGQDVVTLFIWTLANSSRVTDHFQQGKQGGLWN